MFTKIEIVQFSNFVRKKNKKKKEKRRKKQRKKGRKKERKKWGRKQKADLLWLQFGTSAHVQSSFQTQSSKQKQRSSKDKVQRHKWFEWVCNFCPYDHPDTIALIFFPEMTDKDLGNCYGDRLPSITRYLE